MAKKLNKNQREYQHQLSLLKRRIKSAEKRGYSFANFDTPFPESPKRVTQKMIADVKKLRGVSLLREATYTRPTGQTITGYERYREEQQIAQSKARTTHQEKQRRKEDIPTDVDMALNSFMNMYSAFNSSVVEFFDNWLRNLLQRYGKKAVAEMLIKGQQDGLIISREVMYKEGEAQRFVTKMMDYLEIPKDQQADLLDEMDNMEVWEDE